MWMLLLKQYIAKHGYCNKTNGTILCESNLKIRQLSDLSKETQHDILYRNPKWKRFIFVRNPIKRILSAYNDKFQDWEPAFRPEIDKIIKKFRPQEPKGTCPGNITLSEAWLHISDNLEWPKHRIDKLDMHWIRYTNRCDPCNIPYDGIGTQETFTDDMKYMQMSTGVHLPPKVGEDGGIYQGLRCGICQAKIGFPHHHCNTIWFIFEKIYNVFKHTGFVPQHFTKQVAFQKILKLFPTVTTPPASTIYNALKSIVIRETSEIASKSGVSIKTLVKRTKSTVNDQLVKTVPKLLLNVVCNAYKVDFALFNYTSPYCTFKPGEL